jgi:myo-inositol-1(or 4)-monophosphatase
MESGRNRPLIADGSLITLRAVDDLTLARKAAAVAADIIADWAERPGTTAFKGVGNPVTEADRDAESAIIELIGRHRPEDGILGEEGAAVDGASGRRWVIDPLDGTVNFVHGFPHVAVSIGLEDDGGGLVGVVRDVFRDEEFAAHRGGGASLNGSPIEVAGTTVLGNALVATGFSYDRQERGPAYGRALGEMLKVVRGVRRLGSAALDLAWVACGRLDGYWEARLGPWDVAAGFVIVAESGGVTTGYDGTAPTHASCVAANPMLQPQLRAAVVAALDEV